MRFLPDLFELIEPREVAVERADALLELRGPGCDRLALALPPALQRVQEVERGPLRNDACILPRARLDGRRERRQALVDFQNGGVAGRVGIDLAQIGRRGLGLCTELRHGNGRRRRAFFGRRFLRGRAFFRRACERRHTNREQQCKGQTKDATGHFGSMHRRSGRAGRGHGPAASKYAAARCADTDPPTQRGVRTSDARD